MEDRVAKLQSRADRTPQRRTLAFMDAMYEILEEHNPMTVRQLFYQLVSKQIIENSKEAYNKVVRDLRNARLQDRIPWDWVEDRGRQPVIWVMWNSPEDFMYDAADSYRRQIWDDQDCYIEVTVEKDALSGIFRRVLREYRVTLNIGRGFASVSAEKKMADRFVEYEDKPIYLLAFGDFDSEGLAIPKTVEAALTYHQPDLDVTVKRCALTWDDIQTYNLPPNLTKPGSKLAPEFIAQYGDNTVELDALPIDVLEQRIRDEVEDLMDMDAFAEIEKQEEAEREQLRQLKL
jgi:DNA topoisomerase VI subunit A